MSNDMIRSLPGSRVAALLGVSPLVRERGVDPAEVLASLDLAPNTLDDAKTAFTTAWPASCSSAVPTPRLARISGCWWGNGRTSCRSGMLGELMQRSPTLRTALRSLLLHLHLQTRGGLPTHGVAGANATLGYAIYQQDMPRSAQGYDLVMAFEFNILRALCGARWLPGEVSFSHAKPKDVRPYQQFFRSPLRFDADRSEIAFDKTWLDHELPGSDAELHLLLQRELSAQEMLRPMTEQIRRALRTMILSGGASEARIAKLLSIPTRTLHRLLAAQSTTLREILEEVRYDFARQLLTDP